MKRAWILHFTNKPQLGLGWYSAQLQRESRVHSKRSAMKNYDAFSARAKGFPCSDDAYFHSCSDHFTAQATKPLSRDHTARTSDMAGSDAAKD